MLHVFERRFCFRSGGRLQSFLHTALHRLRLCMLGWLYGERDRSGDASALDAKERNRTSDGARLNHERGETVEAVHDFWKLTQDGFEFFDASMNSGGVFERQSSGCGFAIGGKFAEQ